MINKEFCLYKIKNMNNKIICHMIGTVDGRLRTERYSPLHGDAPEYFSNDLYLKKNLEQNADAWIVGRVSVQ